MVVTSKASLKTVKHTDYLLVLLSRKYLVGKANKNIYIMIIAYTYTTFGDKLNHLIVMSSPPRTTGTSFLDASQSKRQKGHFSSNLRGSALDF